MFLAQESWDSFYLGPRILGYFYVDDLIEQQKVLCLKWNKQIDET